MKRRDFLLSVSCGCCSVFLSSCVKAPITERRQVSFYPESLINSQAEVAYKRLKDDYDKITLDMNSNHHEYKPVTLKIYFNPIVD